MLVLFWVASRVATSLVRCSSATSAMLSLTFKSCLALYILSSDFNFDRFSLYSCIILKQFFSLFLERSECNVDLGSFPDPRESFSHRCLRHRALGGRPVLCHVRTLQLHRFLRLLFNVLCRLFCSWLRFHCSLRNWGRQLVDLCEESLHIFDNRIRSFFECL